MQQLFASFGTKWLRSLPLAFHQPKFKGVDGSLKWQAGENYSFLCAQEVEEKWMLMITSGVFHI